MYGVDYNPNEEVVGYTDASGQFVEVPGATKVIPTEGKKAGTVVYQGLPAGVTGTTKTKGEIMGYNPDDHISEMDLMDKQVQDAFGLTDDETKAIRSGFSLQAATNKAAETLIPGQTEAAASTSSLTTATNKAAETVIPSSTEASISGNTLTTATNTANLGLVQPKAELDAAEIGESKQQIAARSPIIDKYFQEAGEDINVTERMNEASGDVAQASSAARSSLGRNVALRGGNIESGYGRSMLKDLTSDTMKADAFARTNARRTAETESLERKRSALTLGSV
jgi:hypothetical protein